MTSTGPMLARRHGGSMPTSVAPGPAARTAACARTLGEGGPAAPSQARPATTPFPAVGSIRPAETARQVEPRGQFSISNIAGPAAQFRSKEPFGPIGPVRPVDPGTGLTIPIPPGGFRPQGDVSEFPTPAGVYDALLGGTSHRRADRRFALAVLLEWPDAPAAARATREFLIRSVRFAARNGVNQFLVPGGGMQTVDPVHEIACGVAPESQTVYVDPDPQAVARATADIDTDTCAVVHGDIAAPDAVLAHPVVRTRLDVTRPMAVVMVPGLPQVADEGDPRAVLAGYREVTPRGSLLIFSQVCDEGSARGLRGLFEQAGQPGCPRSHQQTVEMVSTWEPIEPGLVPAEEWNAPDERPRPHVGRLPVYASVGWH